MQQGNTGSKAIAEELLIELKEIHNIGRTTKKLQNGMPRLPNRDILLLKTT